jgi:acyl carrier protein
LIPDRQQLQADLLALVRARGLDHAGIAADTDLVDGGLLDSLLLTDLILHIEERYAVAFDAGDVSPANFRSVATMVDLVLGRSPVPQSAEGIG